MGERVRVYVTTCDAYLPALRPFAWLLNKNWRPNPEVVVGGFTKPDFDLPSNFTFHSIGKQEDYPFSKWTNAASKMITDLPDEVFVLMLEDMWITRGVDTKAVQVLADYMHQFRYVARIDLTGDRLYAHGMRKYGSVAHLDLIVSMPGSPYHLSLMPGLWRKEHWLSVIQPDWTPWQVELQGTPELSHKSREMIVLGTRQWPIRNILALRGGDVGKLLLNDIDETDVRELRRIGFLSHWEEEK